MHMKKEMFKQLLTAALLKEIEQDCVSQTKKKKKQDAVQTQ